MMFLATGHSFRSLYFEFCFGRKTISDIIWETCNVLWFVLKDKVMPQPQKEDWLRIAEENFPNCIGALDGKHVRLVKPELSGSNFFNYKNYCSIVLLALVDTNYCFVTVDVGSYGRTAD
ncbi:hypothetical protein NQ314_015967 [Rhamnusium bicolor]|uniref:DDE Tnp4 domain-containing protein n=1 Tax=Rhamnusium bicolor TaxID=1586634 RepID=A0AAV8WXD1_9CUCU|nr:hypothetical protein NQ314_015967 [Rhamnusium bicolor]